MEKHQIGGLNLWLSAGVFVAMVALQGCSQPQPQADTSMPISHQQASNTKPNVSSTNRIMARLDGLSGQADPRLATLRGRFDQLGFTIISMGVSAASTTLPSQQSAFIVVAIDPAKTDMEKALALFRTTEAFAYVEADQWMQQRK